TRRIGLPGGKAGRDVVPGRFRADEDVPHRARLDVVVEGAGWKKELALKRLGVLGDGRPAALAEGPRQTRGRLEARYLVASPGEPEIGGVAHHLGRERRSVALATAPAVAAGHQIELPRGPPRPGAAEAAAANRHDAPPSRVRTSTRPSGWPISTRSAVPRKSPVSTTPGMARIEVSSTRAAAQSASASRGAQSRVKFPLSVR